MTKIDHLFNQLQKESQTAFMPFVTAGDPDLEFTKALLTKLDDAGCHLVELGFPYSDPIADGPTIQESYTRALDAGVTVEEIFDMVSQVSDKIKMPIVSMVSYALIFRYGPEQFVSTAKASGISGAIVPDLPHDESDGLAEICAQNEFNLIQLITPTTSDDRAVKIAKSATGFIYYVSVSGITGERNELPTELTNRIQWLKQNTETPVCVGFGIGSPDQAAALNDYADGVIVGSAIIRRIAQVSEIGRDDCITEIAKFAEQMVSATIRP